MRTATTTDHSCSTVAMAIAEIPSPRPIAPRLRSSAFTLTLDSEADRLRDFLSHRRNVRRKFRRLGDNGCIDIDHTRLYRQAIWYARKISGCSCRGMLVGVWEMLTDVARRSRPAARPRSRAREHRHRNVLRAHANARSQHRQGSVFVLPQDDARHSRFHIESSDQSFKSIRPLEATTLYLSFMSSRGRRSTIPPAVSIKSQPAAMSQRLIPCSM